MGRETGTGIIIDDSLEEMDTKIAIMEEEINYKKQQFKEIMNELHHKFFYATNPIEEDIIKLSFKGLYNKTEDLKKEIKKDEMLNEKYKKRNLNDLEMFANGIKENFFERIKQNEEISSYLL